MIIITGGAGFIGSNLIQELNSKFIYDIYIFDQINKLKKKNLKKIIYKKIYHKNELFNFLKKNKKKINVIFHLGANTNTQEIDWDLLYKNNFIFTKKLMIYSALNNTKLIYASSASVYGKKSGNTNELRNLHNLEPLNLYSKSKLIADEFLKKDIKNKAPIIGLRYFNVYGLNEDHKLNMASPVHTFYKQISREGLCKVFKKYDGFEKGEHSRDFVSVKDCVSINLWLMKKKITTSTILNVGTGKSYSFNFVAETLLKNIGIGKIKYIKFPESIKKGYQSKTKANINSLRNIGYKKKMINLQDGIVNFLNEKKYDK